MRIPGFAVEPTAAHGANAGDLLVAQQFTCEEEMRTVCSHQCRSAHRHAACVRKWLARVCDEEKGGFARGLPGISGATARVTAGDRVVPQYITCEEEQGP